MAAGHCSTSIRVSRMLSAATLMPGASQRARGTSKEPGDGCFRFVVSRNSSPSGYVKNSMRSSRPRMRTNSSAYSAARASFGGASTSAPKKINCSMSVISRHISRRDGSRRRTFSKQRPTSPSAQGSTSSCQVSAAPLASSPPLSSPLPPPRVGVQSSWPSSARVSSSTKRITGTQPSHLRCAASTRRMARMQLRRCQRTSSMTMRS
mmetsp:Transcript_30250/g.96493  ORF Transcript_30250/g.96493 Transcript_30250/m.96493 type:complete len:207 (+) Transcript_30250:648-1268(+)